VLDTDHHAPAYSALSPASSGYGVACRSMRVALVQVGGGIRLIWMNGLKWTVWWSLVSVGNSLADTRPSYSLFMVTCAGMPRRYGILGPPVAVEAGGG